MKRTTLRRIGLAAAGLVLVALATLTAVRVHGSMTLDHAAERFEDAVGPLEFEAYRPDPVPDRDNAALPVLEAVEHLEAHLDEGSWREAMGRLKREIRRPAAEWSSRDVARAQEALASRPEVLALLHRAAGRVGSSYRLDYSAGPEMEIPNLLLTLQAADLLFAEARVAWLDGRPDEAVRAVEALAALSLALETEAPLIFQIVGQAVETLQYRAIQDALAVGGVEPETLRRLRASGEDRPRQELFHLSLGAEGTFLHSMRQGGPFAEALARSQTYYGRLEHRVLGDSSVARGLEYYARVADALPRLSYAEMRDRPDLLTPPPDDSTGLVVGLGPTVATFQATEALERLTRLALDLALSATRDGSYPETLPAGVEDGPDPFAGTRPIYERSRDGSVTLTIPGADRLWREVKPGRITSDEEAPLFRWRLAPPSS